MQDIAHASVAPRKMLSTTSIKHMYTLCYGDNNTSINNMKLADNFDLRISEEKYTEYVKTRDRALPYKS